MPLTSEVAPIALCRAAAPAGGKLRRRAASVLSAALVFVTLGSVPAFAVCEELTLQFFSGQLNFLASASQPCREFIRLNVANHAYRTTLLEVCGRKRNYSGPFRNEIYKQANKCVDKKSASWFSQQYSASASEELRNWKGLTSANPSFCSQKEVRDYIEASQQILQQTRDQAKQYCSN
jgi:hypothetical protein